MKKDSKAALKWIVSILNTHKIRFQISGGAAAKIYGSGRRLVDIDIDVPESKFKVMLPEVKKYIVYGPKLYKDPHFRLWLMTLKYKGQKIDISGAHKGKHFDHKRKKWVPIVTHFNTAKKKKFLSITVPVINKRELIAYKRELGRGVDIRDVKALTKHG